jgi:hypothetical protein
MKILKPGEYQWKETQGGTGWSLLRHDPRRDTQTRLLRYSRGVTVPAAQLDHTVEWLVLRGEARCGTLHLRRRGYFCWPAGEQREAVVPGEDGYTVLSFVYGPDSTIRKSPAAIQNVDALPWEEGEALPGAGPVRTRTLKRDPDSAAVTQLIGLSAERSLPLFRAPVLKELFILEGSLAAGGERIPPATYVVLDRGDEWGPLKALGSDALLLVNSHDDAR